MFTAILFLFFISAIIALVFANSIDIEGELYVNEEFKVIVAEEFAHELEKFGDKLWHYFECTGYDWVLRCGHVVRGCLETKNIAGCLGSISCGILRNVKHCASYFE